MRIVIEVKAGMPVNCWTFINRKEALAFIKKHDVMKAHEDNCWHEGLMHNWWIFEPNKGGMNV